jgi:hypothetical protein
VARRVEPEYEGVAKPTAAGSPLPLLTVALLAGLYAMAPGIYLGGLHVRRGAEIVDHVIPGLIVIAMVGIGLFWGVRSTTVTAYAGLVVLIAGLFMVLAHIGLFRQAINHQVGWGGAAYHCSTAALVFVVGLTWVWRYRRGLSD